MKRMIFVIFGAVFLCGAAAGEPTGVAHGVVTAVAGGREADPAFTAGGVDFFSTRLTEYVGGGGGPRGVRRGRKVSVRWVRDRDGGKTAARVVFDPKTPPRGRHECDRKCCCGSSCEGGFACPCVGESCEVFLGAGVVAVLKGDPDNVTHDDETRDD